MQNRLRHSGNLSHTLGSSSSVSSWTPQRLGVKILFWGKVSEISGGEMPNKVTGSSDFLTVAGSPYTFQTPNTAPYIAADTDYIWFKTNAVQRTTTTAELIGYDLQRTPAKYGDVAPNTLTEIVILKSGASLTASEVNNLHAYMHLSMFWSGVENDYGYLKDNRIGQQLWTPESVYDNAETVALVARMTAAGETPSAERATLIDDTFTASKLKAFHVKLEGLWLLAAHGTASEKMNILENDHNCTGAGSGANPTSETDRGVTMSTNNALKTDFLPNTDKTTSSQNSSTIGYYSRTHRVAADIVNMSGENPAGTGLFIAPEWSTGVTYAADNSVVLSQAGIVTDTSGMFILSRTASNVTKLYRNITMLKEWATVSEAIKDIEIHIGCRNANGVLSAFSTEQFALAFKASGFDSTDVSDFVEVWVDGYLNTIGAKV